MKPIGLQRLEGAWRRRLVLIGIGVAAGAGALSACQLAEPPALPACNFFVDAGPDQTVIVGSLVQLDGAWSSGNAPGQAEFFWEDSQAGPSGSTAVLSDVTALDPTFVANVEGPYPWVLVVQETVDDACGDKLSEQKAMDGVTITAVALLADAGPDQTVDLGTQVTLDASNSAPSAAIQSYAWTRVSQTGQSSAPASGSGPTLSFTLDDPDQVEYRLTVDDGTNQDDTTVVVRSSPPTITTLTPNSGPVGTRVTIAGTNFSMTPSQNTVTFNGTPAPVASASPTYDQLEADVPTGATTGPVMVTVLGTGDAAIGPDFTVTGPPVGGTWTLVSSTVTGDIPQLLDLAFPTAVTGYAVGGGGSPDRPYYAKTTDGGMTWMADSISPPPGTGGDVAMHGVAFANADTGWAVGGLGRVFQTMDGGASWAQQPTTFQTTLNGVSFIDGLNGIAVGAPLVAADSAILTTNDGGANWVGQSDPSGAGLFAVHFQDAANAWAVGPFFGSPTILYSSDGGASWINQGAQAPTGTAELLDVFFIDAMRGWAVGRRVAGGPWVIMTADGGATWDSTVTQPAGSSALTGVSFVDAMSGTVVGIGGTIFRTDDGGATWADEAGANFATLNDVHMLNPVNGVAVGLQESSTMEAAIYRRE